MAKNRSFNACGKVPASSALRESKHPAQAVRMVAQWLALSVATVMATNPRPFTLKLPDGATGTGRRVMPFSLMEDWIVAPSGRVALVRTSPYRVDWRELDGRLTIGTPVQFTPVPVTEADRKAREPNGPPFRLEYPTTKPAFRDGTLVVDEQDRGPALHRVCLATSTERSR